MARAIRDGSEDFSLTILFGSRTRETVLFADEFNEITTACPKVKVVHVLSDEEAEGYEHGFITAELIRKYAPEEEYSIFLCGPEAMYRFVMPEVDKLGLPRRLVRREMLGVTKNVAAQPGYPTECAGKTFGRVQPNTRSAREQMSPSLLLSSAPVSKPPRAAAAASAAGAAASSSPARCTAPRRMKAAATVIS